MQLGTGVKFGVSSIFMLFAISIFALFVAFMIVPLIAQAAGLHEQHVNYAVAGAAFVIAIVATQWGKYLNRKAAEK